MPVTMRQPAPQSGYSTQCRGAKAPAVPAQVLQAQRENSTLFVGFANGGYVPLMRNWAAHLQRLGLPHLVISLDEPALQACREHSIHTVPWMLSLGSQ